MFDPVTQPENMRMIGVIIPYFQVERGILRRCLEAVLAQTLKERILIVVVDDESPHPAGIELQELELPANVDICVQLQANAGPSAARNRGIAVALAHQADVIAFLDSDDIWNKHHLEAAVDSINNSHDMYSCDWNMVADGRRGFELKGLSESDLACVCPRARVGTLKRPLFDQEVFCSLIKLSCLVVSASFIGNTRFNERLRHASEDRLFVMLLAMKKPRVALGLNTGLIAGRGVSIYESIQYGSLQSLKSLGDQLYGRREMAKLLSDCDKCYRIAIYNEIASIKRQIAKNVGACLKQRDATSLRHVIEIAKSNPDVIPYIFTENLKTLFQKAWAGLMERNRK